MYDLEIAVPAETNVEKILNRFTDFKKWGFLNIGNTKIKLYLLSSLDNDPRCLATGWPEGIKVETIVTPYKEPVQRIIYYYTSICKPDTANWYISLDEDSMTDIGGLMNNLKRLFDPEKEYHIGGEFEITESDIEQQILTSLGYDWWYEHPGNYPPHEHEISVTSKATIKKILKNESAMQYLTIRQEFDRGHGDHALCYCARMCKIHPFQSNFLTRNPTLTSFSLFGGQYNHIHWTARDQNPCVLEWLDSIDETKTNLFDKKTFFFSSKEQTHLKKEWISLTNNNEIKIVNKNNSELELPKLWGLTKNNDIILFYENFDKNDPLILLKNINGSTFESKDYKLIINTN